MIVNRFGGPEVLTPTRLLDPVPGDGEVVVRHRAIGVNFVDTQHRTGSPYPVELPLVPGIEASGVVEGLGPGVEGVALGDRVAYAGPMAGVYAEAAFVLTHRVHSPTTGDRALVHAAAGGVGSLIVQFLVERGVRVFGTASSDDKLDYLRELRVHLALSSRHDDLATRIREQAPEGVDAVFDSIGRSTFEAT